jgi:hypothetical protein
MLSLDRNRFLRIYMNRKIRYALLVSLMASPSFSMGWNEELPKILKSKVSITTTTADIRILKVAARSMVYTAFGYSEEKSARPSPQNLGGEDLEKVLRNYNNFEKQVKTFQNIIKEYGVPVTDSHESSEQWRDLNAILALSNSVYPEDRSCSKKEIDSDTKQIMAIRCLLEFVPEFLKENHTKVCFETNAFELAKQINEEPKRVIISEKNADSEEKLCYIVSEVEDFCGTKKIEEKPDTKEVTEKIVSTELPVKLIKPEPSKNENSLEPLEINSSSEHNESENESQVESISSGQAVSRHFLFLYEKFHNFDRYQ